MSRTLFALLSVLTIMCVVLGACAQPTPEPSEAPAEAPGGESAEESAGEEESQGLPGEMEGKSWDDILQEAKGQTVNFYHWGGSDLWNAWYSGSLKDRLEEYGITLNTVPVAAPTEFVDKILNEAAAGVEKGSVDLVWISAENFKSCRQADTLYGPYADRLPNAAYCDWDNPGYQYDAGYPIEGYESPWLSGQVVVIYNTACASDLPVTDGVITIDALKQWIIDNPGKFTYTAPPEFTATAFLTAIFYHTTGGHEQWQGEFDQEVFDQKARATWDWLNEIEPYMWREGETYPESLRQLDDLFANGEVCFSINYGIRYADNMIAEGRFPETARTFVFETGTVANWNYVTIPKNSGNKAAALVAANLLMSPEVQYEVANPDVMGSSPGITLSMLPEEWQEKFNSLPRGEATLPPTVLGSHQIPPLSAEMLPIFEQAWEENVLKQ